VAEKLQEFVQTSMVLGKSSDEIRSALVAQGWQKDEIESALASFARLEGFPPVPRPAPSYAKDAFLSLVTFFSLGMFVFYFGSLGFDALTLLWPPPEPGWDPQWTVRDLKIDIVGTLFAGVIWAVLTWRWHKSSGADVARRLSPVRKWLTSLTLVVSAIAVIGDVFVILRGIILREGQPTDIFKGLVVLAVSAAAFFYYRYEQGRTDVGR